MGFSYKMTDQAKKGKNTKDYISQIKKETEGVQENNGQVADEEWYRNASDDEEVTANKATVIEQGKVMSDKPKKLKDIFSSGDVQKPKMKKRYEPNNNKKVGDVKDGEMRKQRFTNSKGEQNKDQGFKVSGDKSYKLEKPSFHNKSGKVDRPLDKVNEKYVPSEKFEPKKFTGMISQQNEDNQKIKPTKDYLDADTKNKYKEDEPEIEKPKFMGREGEHQEPRFTDINRNEDLFLKKMTEANVNLT